MVADQAVLGILCVDDNRHVAQALRIKLDMTPGFQYVGWLQTADDLVRVAEECRPDIVILDLDMPGRSAFEATEELQSRFPDVRVVVFSGFVRRNLIDRAVSAGVWGFASKNDGADALIEVLRRVMNDEFALSPEASATYERG